MLERKTRLYGKSLDSSKQSEARITVIVAGKTLNMILVVHLLCIALHSPGQAAVLTHGPMVGHTTDTTTRIWIRADGSCKMQVRLTSEDETFVSETIRLVRKDNFCGSAEVTGLSPRTTYSYRVFLDNKGQACPVKQLLTTFPRECEQCVIRIGFGHSLRGEGAQRIWDAIGEKRPDLFILMGDNIYSNSTEPGKQRKMYLQFRADPLWNSKGDREKGYFRAFGLVTVDTNKKFAKAHLEFFDLNGQSHQGRRILYTELGALRALLDSPQGVTGVSQENRRYIDRLSPGTSKKLWEILPFTTGETLTEHDLRWP